LISRTRLSVTIVVCLAAVGLATFACGQTITANPTSVDPARPAKVTLTITPPDTAKGLIEKVEAVTVGGQPATIGSKDAAKGTLEITPPSLTATGDQPLELLDKDKASLAKGTLRYTPAPDQGAGDEHSLSREQQEYRWEARRDKLAEYDAYYFLVTMIFLFVLVPFVAAVYRATRATDGAEGRPLGLPVGSFRSILAYTLVTYLGFYVLSSILSLTPFGPPEFLLGTVSTVIGFYFGSRSGEEAETKAGKTGIVRGRVRDGEKPAAGARVAFARGTDGAAVYTRFSDVEGRFEVTGVLVGKYIVQASVAGPRSSKPQEVTVVEGADLEIEILIAPPQS
jgi:Carboxypeptidase regulatory-like domain